MAGLTLEARQALYEADIRIIDTQADDKINKLGIAYHKIEEKHLADLEKKKTEYSVVKQKRVNRNELLRADELRKAAGGSEAKLSLINKKWDNANEEAELEYDQSENGAIERDMRILDPIEARFNKAVEAVEVWRAREKASESRQLEHKTQRARKP